MIELIKSIRKNRNTKYYELLIEYLDIINNPLNNEIKASVDDILKQTNISRPTFYNYYSDAEEFYVDLMEIISHIIPKQMMIKSQELKGSDFLQLGYEMKIGVILGNMKKVSGRFPKVLIPWNDYFEHSVKNMGFWYSKMKSITPEEGMLVARMVLNELILHDDIYYKDFDVYKDLMLNQKTHF